MIQLLAQLIGEELALCRIGQLLSKFQLLYYLEEVALFDEELLTFGRIVHLLGVGTHEGVEVRVKIL